ncbi:Enolase-phosphatase E1 [Candida viswanathii]|uniref:Enolase-phosphatase E1 n=1 Tax=Candida viswanathii TaxID=5486 RepID=A0A367XLY9_9ASCO|nr:Enolase-phosphatase E1 [Candida viswanathii]
MPIDTVILDIEGTVCPITFVKDVLFPYFIQKLPSILAPIRFPLPSPISDPIVEILAQLPSSITTSSDTVYLHLKSLVDQDIKDPVLKALQGYVWKQGYESGELKAPVYADSIKFIREYAGEIYIYSSGSIKAQILLFGHVDDEEKSVDLNSYLKGYFDITTAGFKNQAASYSKILNEIGKLGESVLFLSDNVNEVRSAIEAGMSSYVVVRPGNAPLSDEDKAKYKTIHSLDELSL